MPWIDAKYYAGTQTMDEARHVEVFSRYLREKLEWEWPINENLKKLLDATIHDSRWDFKYLGMQILIEGLAMAAFGNLYQLAQEPLLKELHPLRDEGRVAPRRLRRAVAARTTTRTCRPSELQGPRGLRHLRLRADARPPGRRGDRGAMGWDPQEVREIVLGSPIMKLFRQSLFARVVPNLKRLGLLTPRVREGFEELDIIQFENVDPEAQDRALGF